MKAKSTKTSYWQAAPMAAVFTLFFVVPLAVIVIVSFWQYNQYSITPAFILSNYTDIFSGCVRQLPDLCTTFATYLQTLIFCAEVWALTLVIGFAIAYFLVFEVRTPMMQVVLALICTIPFWTSNVIRMISWIPLLGRNGLINQGLLALGVTDHPVEWLLYSHFSVLLAFVHLNTVFMIIPILNSMARIDRSLIEAARDGGASGWQTLWNVLVPLSKPGIAIGSIFVITVVMGDYITIGIMGGQQIASVGKVIQVQTNFLQFPLAAANAVVLLATVLALIFGLTRLVDIRKEL
ncbi:ABC transporter permease [Defluviimonas sp. 20V17]|uniref:ABC transporter permease n=1 Tax=Allgaiera indica TaxID=765699 RepID=A0AAN5A1U0_9RHOB|nr:ABC transporter permease [Allgaiera indica]KDB05300.1 ABC transporter permease [Defluviimonas sp. 20V17]GHE04828.1 ABC transporter permease [Allgaiera indica]SDX53316.1 putative spermidine/putrescine transport system permease protein [Allgaiera indica]